jgi:transcriptional regulator GlxA family with amidase domain
MQARLGEADLTLTEVADTLFVSVRQLQRAFASSGSAGFRHELARMRVREGAQIIHQHPERSIASVAAAVGYRQPPFFAKTFREQLGKSPGVWRRQCQGHARDAAAQGPENDLLAA